MTIPACRNQALESHHEFECGEAIAEKWNLINTEILESQDKLTVSHHQLCYRIISKKSMDFWKENFDNLRSNKNQRGSNGEKFLPQDYKSFYSLVSHEGKTPEPIINIMLVSARVHIHHMIETGYITNQSTDINLMMRVIIHTLLIMRYNTHAIIESHIINPRKPTFVDVRSIGCGAYPSLCLLNTSCDQNITKYHNDNVVVGLASKIIRAGEEVSDNYFPSAAYMPRDQRRDWLSQHFMFNCQCVACDQNMPLLVDMPKEAVRYLFLILSILCF